MKIERQVERGQIKVRRAKVFLFLYSKHYIIHYIILLNITLFFHIPLGRKTSERNCQPQTKGTFFSPIFYKTKLCAILICMKLYMMFVTKG